MFACVSAHAHTDTDTHITDTHTYTNIHALQIIVDGNYCGIVLAILSLGFENITAGH